MSPARPQAGQPTRLVADLRARAGELRESNEALRARIAERQSERPTAEANEAPALDAAQAEVATLEREGAELSAQLDALEGGG